jgi:thioredoxin 1
MASELIKHVSDASFEADVLQSEHPVLVDYWAEWCGPCKMIAPILDEVATGYEGKLQIAKMNVDENRDDPGQVRHPRHPDADAVQGRPAGRHQGRRHEQVAAVAFIDQQLA